MVRLVRAYGDGEESANLRSRTTKEGLHSAQSSDVLYLEKVDFDNVLWFFISTKCDLKANWSSFFAFTRISTADSLCGIPEHELVHAQGAVGERHGEVVRVRRRIQDRFVVRPAVTQKNRYFVINSPERTKDRVQGAPRMLSTIKTS